MDEKQPTVPERVCTPEEAAFVLKWAVIFPFVAISTAVAAAEVLARFIK